MSIPHFEYNPGTAGGGRIRQLNLALEMGQDMLLKELATIVSLCEGGDPSNAANFTKVTSYYGYKDNTDAKGSYDEMQSMSLKINTDASVSSVSTAIKNCVTKHR